MDFFLLLFNGFAFDLILFLVDFKLGLWRVFQWGLFWFWVGFRMGFPMGLGWFWVVLVWFCVGLSTFEMSCTVGSWVVVVVGWRRLMLDLLFFFFFMVRLELFCFFLFTVKRVWGERVWQGREKKKSRIKSYGYRVYLHGYYSNFVYEQYYRHTNVGSFWAKKCKMHNFFLFYIDWCNCSNKGIFLKSGFVYGQR